MAADLQRVSIPPDFEYTQLRAETKSRRDLTYTSCQAQYEHDNEMNFESETKHHLNT